MVSQCESCYLCDTEIRGNLKPCVLESMKYGTNGYIFSALDSSEKKSSCLWYCWFLMYSFFQSLFPFTNGYQSHLLLDCKICPWKPCCWLKSLWVDQIPSLLTAPEWTSSNPPKSTSLANQKTSPPCVLLLSTPLPLSLADFWKSHGRVLGRRRLLYACEKEQSVSAESPTTAVLQNMYIPRLSSRLVPRSCRPRDYSILLKRKKSQKMQSTSLFLAIFYFSSLSLKFVQGDGELFCQNLNRK